MKGSKLAIPLILPSLIIVFGIIIFPLFYCFFLSLNEIYVYNLGHMDFVAFRNFSTLLVAPLFYETLRNTAIFTSTSVTLQILLGLGYALLLNEFTRGKNFFRLLLIIPNMLGGTVTGLLMRWMFSTDYGVINEILKTIGILKNDILWLSEPSTAMFVCIIADVYQMTPFVMLVFLAGLSSIPKDLYEAANIDGAAWHNRFRHITFPFLKSTFLVALILRTLPALTSVFDVIYLLTGGGPSNATLLLPMYAYQITYSYGNFGLGSSLSVILLLISFAITIIYIRIMRAEK